MAMRNRETSEALRQISGVVLHRVPGWMALDCPVLTSQLSAMSDTLSRRALLQRAAAAGVALTLPAPVAACITKGSGRASGPDQARLSEWSGALKGEGLS